MKRQIDNPSPGAVTEGNESLALTREVNLDTISSDSSEEEIFQTSPFSNIFSFKTTWPIKAKFYVEPPWGGGTKVCMNGPGHMTKMAATPIYGKNLQKSSPELVGRFPQNLVCSIGDSSPSYFKQMMTLG